MRIKSESELLDLDVRKAIIEEIKGSENQERKREAYKRYLCFKDKTKIFVIEQLLKQFDMSTVQEMLYCVSNISFTRKIIDKLARVYNNGVKREIAGNEQLEENVKKLEKALDFNSQIRAANKFLKLQKNLAVYVKPCPVNSLDNGEKYTVKIEPMNPYLYDVVEDYNDRTKPMAYILSDFEYNPVNSYTGDVAFAGRSSSGNGISNKEGNGKDEKIADNPDDAKICQFVWWSDNFHFTTNEKGEITSESVENPIKELPFENFAIE